MAKEQPITTKNFKKLFKEAFHEVYEPYARTINKEFEIARKERKIMRKEIATINLKLSDIVYRDEYLNLLKRVEKLEARK